MNRHGKPGFALCILVAFREDAATEQHEPLSCQRQLKYKAPGKPTVFDIFYR
jgi:hypothetical protein